MQKDRHLSKKIDIIGLYIDDYHKILSGREIARKLAINHQTALNSLNLLVKEKIIKFEAKGRNKQYSLNTGNLKTKIMLETAENKNALQLLENSKIRVIMPEILDFAETIIVFGSFASGKEKEDSDLDLVIAGKADKNNIKMMIRKYPAEINAEFVSYEEFEETLKQKKALALEILKNHAIFGDTWKIVDIYWRWHKR